MNDVPLLSKKALRIASDAHEGVKRKNGEDYIEHPIRVSKRVPNGPMVVVAILHDVVEDSQYTLDDLREEGFSERIVKAVDGVTRKKTESYKDFVVRASKNGDSRIVKIADIHDNLSDANEFMREEKDWHRYKKYHLALLFLEGHIDEETYRKWKV